MSERPAREQWMGEEPAFDFFFFFMFLGFLLSSLFGSKERKDDVRASTFAN